MYVLIIDGDSIDKQALTLGTLSLKTYVCHVHGIFSPSTRLMSKLTDGQTMIDIIEHFVNDFARVIYK